MRLVVEFFVLTLQRRKLGGEFSVPCSLSLDGADLTVVLKDKTCGEISSTNFKRRGQL